MNTTPLFLFIENHLVKASKKNTRPSRQAMTGKHYVHLNDDDLSHSRKQKATLAQRDGGVPCFANRSPGPAQTPLSPGRDDLSLRTAGPGTPRPHSGSPSPPQSTDVRVHATPQTPPASDVATTGPRAPLHVGPCRSEDSGRAQGARGFRSRRISDTAWGPPHSLPTSTCSTSRRALPLPPGYLSHPRGPPSSHSCDPVLSSPLPVIWLRTLTTVHRLSCPRHLVRNSRGLISSSSS
jgi:hypothetical protein